MEAVKMVRGGISIRQTARHFGFAHSTVLSWMRKAQNLRLNNRIIPTESSRPYAHPRELEENIVLRICALRKQYNRGAVFIHYMLQKENIHTSLSSVKRTLSRHGLTRFSKWKKWHIYPPRPKAENPGVLVEIDTIHHREPKRRMYVYTMLDVYSRWAFALPVLKIGCGESLRFVKKGQYLAPFGFQMIQSDHGSEFSKYFSKHVGLNHRHSRVRTPNDNAHLERFNRTLQEECLRRIPESLNSWNIHIPEYLSWYNFKRPHMGLDMKSPMDIIRESK